MGSWLWLALVQGPAAAPSELVKAAGGIYAGLMSGTSLDGVDAILAEWSEQPAAGLPRELGFVHLDFAPSLRQELLALNQAGPNELHRAALAANALALVYGQAVQEVLHNNGLRAANIRALGAHGQTIRHLPHLPQLAMVHAPLSAAHVVGGSVRDQRADAGCPTVPGYTMQLLNGALLAERCGIDVVCDFRSRDVAAGGEGAPLVPAFHAASFAKPGRDVAVLNLGGIANWTLLPATGADEVRGFDSGPGNMLLDVWCQRHQGSAYDAGGRWAATGALDEALLARLLAEPFFALAPPKSTGRDLFNADWLEACLRSFPGYSGAAGDATNSARHADVAATLTELTARSAAQALQQHGPATGEVLVCGGGSYNDFLLTRLRANLPAGTDVNSTATAGIAPEKVEAMAFAWLAKAYVENQPGNLPHVTGARGSRVLGALHRA